MTWVLENPEGAKARERYRKRGLAIPRELIPPRMLPGAMEWLEAFWELSTDRAAGMSVGPIPSRSIAAWPVAEDEREAFRTCIRAMDQAFMRHVRGDKEPTPLSISALKEAAQKD